MNQNHSGYRGNKHGQIQHHFCDCGYIQFLITIPLISSLRMICSGRMRYCSSVWNVETTVQELGDWADGGRFELPCWKSRYLSSRVDFRHARDIVHMLREIDGQVLTYVFFGEHIKQDDHEMKQRETVYASTSPQLATVVLYFDFHQVFHEYCDLSSTLSSHIYSWWLWHIIIFITLTQTSKFSEMSMYMHTSTKYLEYAKKHTALFHAKWSFRMFSSIRETVLLRRKNKRVHRFEKSDFPRLSVAPQFKF